MAAVTGIINSTFQDMVGNASGYSGVTATGGVAFDSMTGTGVGFAGVVGTGASTFEGMRGYGSGVVAVPVGPVDGFFYAVVPGIIPTPFPGDAVFAGPPVIMSPRVLMEHQLKDRKIVGYRSDLTDGRRIFRVEERFLDKLQKDPLGYYVEIIKVKYYFKANNPVTANDTFFHEWGPL